MIEFERFIKELGAAAEKYTEEQLRRLHLEAHAIAEILLAHRKAMRKQRSRARSPQPSVDKGDPDRTIGSSITSPDDAVEASQASEP